MTDFDSMDSYLALPRVTELALSPDGTRLVATIGQLNEDGNERINALWELDPAGAAEARRLTRSDKGESTPVFRPDGSLLFVSKRGGEDDKEPPALWQLPATGEPERVLKRAGGVTAIGVARDAGTVVVSGEALPDSVGDAADEKRRTARKEAKVGATLHTGSPVRFWDHDLGPGELRLFAVPGNGTPVDLTPTPGRALDETSFVVTPDGSLVLTSWNETAEPGYPRPRLIAIDTATGAQRVLAADPSAGFEEPAVSPDGRWAAAVRWQDNTYDDPPLYSLWLVDLAGGEGRELVADADIWPGSPRFSPDGTTLYFLADETGHRPVFRLDIGSGAITRVTASGHYDQLIVAPDGNTLYALRDAVDSPPRPTVTPRSSRRREPPRRPASSNASTPRGTTAPPSRRGSCCRPAHRPMHRHRCCSGSTAGRSARGTAGAGGGTRG
jgi:dipeptidyl aminopeptidase/acylaminoacyl peptidase